MALHTADSRLPETGNLLRQLQLNCEQREDPPLRRRSWPIGGAILVLLLVAGGAVAFLVLRGEQFEVQSAMAVAPSLQGGPSATLQASGYVTARRQATVSVQITGTLTEVLIEEGEYVQAGQVLARLESTAQQASLAQAYAHFQAAQALLGQFDVQLSQARRDHQRSEDLVARRLVSQQALEAARTQVESLQAQVASQAKQVEVAQAAVQGAEVQLSYTTVRAPFPGVIVAKAAQAGETVSPMSAGGGFTRTGVGTIVDMDSLEIEVDVNESYINRVKPGQLAEATLDAYSDWTIPAHVIAIIPTADRNKSTVKVRVAIEQPDPRILPDMGVRVTFLEDRNADERAPPPKGVLVPASAIVERGGMNVVFTIDNHRARARPVVSGQTYGELRLVEGVAASTQVVRAPPTGLTDGARLIVTSQNDPGQ